MPPFRVNEGYNELLAMRMFMSAASSLNCSAFTAGLTATAEA